MTIKSISMLFWVDMVLYIFFLTSAATPHCIEIDDAFSSKWNGFESNVAVVSCGILLILSLFLV